MSFAAKGKQKKKRNVRNQDKPTPHTVLQNLSPKTLSTPLKVYLDEILRFSTKNKRILTLGVWVGHLWSRKWLYHFYSRLLRVNHWSPGGSFMIQKMALSSPISIFKPLGCGWVVYDPENVYIIPNPRLLKVNSWSPSGSSMVQKMAIPSPIPVFEGLNITCNSIFRKVEKKIDNNQ